MKSFNNKVAVITGAASGIGRALAKECIKRKMKVVLADINYVELINLKNESDVKNKNIIIVKSDVTKKSNLEKLKNKVISKFGRVDFLFNNAGISGPFGELWKVSEKELKELLSINLIAMISVLRIFIPIMLMQDKKSYIINTASGSGFYTNGLHTFNLPVYMATKHAIVALSEQLYLDLQKRKPSIKVSVLCPGSVSSNFFKKIKAKTYPNNVSESVQKFADSIEQGLQPEEVARKAFDGIINNKFYIFTHFSSHKKRIGRRMRNILLKKNPRRIRRGIK